MTLHSLQGSECYPTKPVIEHYAMRAKGGAACVNIGGVSIFPTPVSDGEHAHFDVYTKQNVYYLQDAVDAIHFYGAKVCLECGTPILDKPYAVSAGNPLMAPEPSEEMPKEYMEYLCERFAFAAEKIAEVGADALLLHFGHSLVFGQFLSPYFNKRTDEFGGSIENRARFLIMVLDAIRARIGRKVLIELRVSGSEKIEGGISVNDIYELSKLIEGKIDILHVSAGCLWADDGMSAVHPTCYDPEMPNIQYAAALKKMGCKIPIVTLGGVQKPEDVERIIAEGGADLVAIGRGLIADPMMPEKAWEGRSEDIVPCIKCLRCHDSACFETKFVCAVNPVAGFEQKMFGENERMPKRSCKVAIVGGGVAGMEAAIVCRQRGHEVTLYEASDKLGGQLNFADYADFKSALRKFKNYMIAQTEKSGAEIKLNTTVTAEMLKAENPDYILCALGATSLFPPIPGISPETVVAAPKAYGHESELADKVLVLGGGQVGCETALHLARMGKDVTILEMQSELAPDASVSLRETMLYHMGKEKNLHVLTNCKCQKLEGGVVSYLELESGEEKTIEAPSVVLALGMKPNSEQREALRVPGIKFVDIGDCTKVSTVERAMRTAYDAAVNVY